MLTEKLREFADRQKLNFNKAAEEARRAAEKFIAAARQNAAVQYAHAAEAFAAARQNVGEETVHLMAAARENAAVQRARAAEKFAAARQGAQEQCTHAAELIAAAKKDAGEETKHLMAAAKENAAAQRAHAAEKFAACRHDAEEQAAAAAAAVKAKASEKYAEAAAAVKIAKTVAGIQLATLKRRVCGFVTGIISRVCGAVNYEVSNIKGKYIKIREFWTSNGEFTFLCIPGNGSHVAKKDIKKKHIKYAFTCFAGVFAGMLCAIGVLAHFAYQNEEQKAQLREFQQTKYAQEQTIKELRQMAENNQKQLAALSKLEDQVRDQMEKSGAQLPPKSDAEVYAGQGGGYYTGNIAESSIIYEQEKNINRQAEAKKADLQNLLSVIESENYRREYTPSIWPTDGGYISSSFGGRRNPFDGYSRDWHPGIDIAVDYGTPVYASASGYVQQAGWYGGYGRYVRISHDFGYVTAYGHMSSIAVNAGQYVKKGDIVGYVGSSGFSTGPHLHYEVMMDGEQVNPSSLL